VGATTNSYAKSSNFYQPFPIYPIVPLGEIVQNSGMENGQNLSIADPQVKILVVDDHPNTANMLARALSHLGSHVDVVSATSGLEALGQVENGAADILITDLMMPEMNGLELIEKLNDKPFSPPAFSFLVTAHDMTDFEETAERLNVKQVISKPVHPESICQIVTQAMDEMKQNNPITTEPISPIMATAKADIKPLTENVINPAQLTGITGNETNQEME